MLVLVARMGLQFRGTQTGDSRFRRAVGAVRVLRVFGSMTAPEASVFLAHVANVEENRRQ